MRLTPDAYIPLYVRAAMAEAIKTAEAGSMPLEWAQMHAALDVLADADLLARPLPSREQIADAIERSGIAIGTTDAEHAADAVLNLLEGRDG